MELNLKDRVIILNSVLQQYGTRNEVELRNSIYEKIKVSTEEEKNLIIQNLGNNQVEIGFKTEEAIKEIKAFDLKDDELFYIKQRIDFIDKQGMFSAETMPTYMKLLDEPFSSEEFTARWEQLVNE